MPMGQDLGMSRRRHGNVDAFYGYCDIWWQETRFVVTFIAMYV